MRLKTITGIVLTVFLLGMLPLAFNVQPVAADGAVDWWPMRGHDLNHTGYSTSTAPNTNNTLWNYTTGSYVESSPAVADGKVFVGSWDQKVYAFAASVWSTDSAGNSKSTFDLTDNVYVRGQGFTADTSVTIYLIPDEKEASPSNATANASTITSSTGDLPVTLVWSQPLTPGEYDIWVDVNQNGVFDGGDAWNSQAIGIYAFNVLPEFPTWTLTLLMLTISTVAIAAYKRKLLKKPTH
jgi:outer membrane protein assembly factor BamB